MALPNGRFAYSAPTIKQAKSISWPIFREYTLGIPGIDFRPAENKIVFPNGAEVMLFSADLHDSIRGHGLDGAVLDEVASFPAEAWPTSIRPTLSDKNGWALFVGTVRGQGDEFHRAYLRGLGDDPEWCSHMFLPHQTGALSQSEIESAKGSMSENQFAREYGCDFSASTEETLIPAFLVMEAMHRDTWEGQLQGAPKIIGVDVARFGDDKTVFARRWGKKLLPTKSLTKADTMQTVGHLCRMIREFRPDAVIVDDGGIGGAVTDRMTQLGYDVIAVNFAHKAIEPERYANRRVEMWDKLKLWLIEGGDLPEEPILPSDLSAPQIEFDAQNRMKLERKEKIKARLGRSPDYGDAFALTFAADVYPRRAVDEHLPLYLQPDHHKEEDWDFTPGVFHDHREYGY
ncbi:hypothetical protein [Roseobacter sp. MH60115]|uniref:hypothetical protein n=1 Tax=Roseobacter sp. MH60115 TaxID=2785324 RepID=UPI0018A2E9C1|nr:hypothetical protein [Roseobacter sp. MH60115]